MIALVTGTVAVRRPDHVIVDCGGVGYRLAVSEQTLRQVPAAGNPVTLHTHLIPRDDALLLYGFATEEERDLFLMLLPVQGVGPKVALDVLSGGPVRDLIASIAAGDSARFQAVKGIGKKIADRIVAELREKVDAEPAIRITRAGSQAHADADTDGHDDDPLAVARAALAGLGYTDHEIRSLLRDADGQSAEELISQALRSARR